MTAIATAEYEARFEQARALMRAREIDAMVVTAEANLLYFAGHAPQLYVSPTRPWFVVLPLAAEPVAVIPTMGLADMRRDSWIERFETWASPRPQDEGVSLLATVLLALPRRFGAIGFELGAEQRLGMPIADFTRLCEGVAPALVAVDAAPIVRALRIRKSAAEVALIGAAIGAAQAAFDALPGLARVGTSETTLYRAFQAEALLAGADRVPYVAIASGPGGYDSGVRGPMQRCLDVGDVLGVDTGATVGGYWADFNRNLALAPVPAAARTAHARLWQAQEAALAMLRPGVRAADVWQALAGALPAASTSIGRMGHGIGLTYTEPPSIHPDDTTVLEAGMVVTLEPSLDYALDGGRRFMVLEEDLLVTTDGPRLLTRRAPGELPVI